MTDSKTVQKQFTGQGRNTAFDCENCGREVTPLKNGSYRNHCPFCLYSLHVDINPGDRANECMGLLEPIGVEHNAKKGWIILYECESCGATGRNKAALDDPEHPDDYDLILDLSNQL